MNLRNSVLVALLWASTATAQTWSAFPPAGSSSGSVIMAGSTRGLVVHSDSGAFEYDGAAWGAISSPVPARLTQAMAFDAVRQRTVLFGGVTISGGLLGDTWEWDGANWSQVPVTGPSARSGAAMAFDLQLQEVVMFGGITPLGFTNQTWVFDGATWQQRLGAMPPIRANAAMAYDKVRNVAVMYGGFGGYSDTWEWNGTQWTQRLASGPTPLQRAGMAWDPHSNRVLMFGGRAGANPLSGYRDEVFDWDGSTWTQRHFATQPSARAFHGMAHNPLTDEIVVLAGGNASAFFLADAWVYPGQIAAGAVAYGAGCGGLSLVSTATPVLGQTATSELRRTAPFNLAFMAIGFNRTNWGPHALPFSLSGYGMPGCSLHHDFSLILFSPCTITAPGVAVHSIAIPVIPSITGFGFYLQGWVPDPPANAAGVITSNGLALMIGSF